MLANTTAEQRVSLGKLARSGWTEESSRQQRESLTGKKHTIITIEKRRNSLIGQFWITDGLRNRKLRPSSAIPDGWHAGMTNRGFSGRKHSAETKSKMLGRVVLDATRQLMRERRLGIPRPDLSYPRSTETKLKISVKLKGRPRSPEAIAKHRATMAARRVAAKS